MNKKQRELLIQTPDSKLIETFPNYTRDKLRTLKKEFTRKPKILFFDIETTPFIGYTWGKWEQNVIEFIQNSYILCFSYAWLDEKVKCISVSDFHGYKKSTNDKEVVKKLWQLFDEADILIGQNLDKFDVKKVNTRFLIYGMKPPSAFKTIDTLKVARKNFSFPSNKLNDLGSDLKIGNKIPHTGFNLWLGCMNGEKKSWDLMKKYCIQDTELLMKLYKKQLPFIKLPKI